MKKRLKIIFFGALAGLCNGLFGAGGGMLVVPCLEKYLSLEPKKAHATAIAVILPLTIVSIYKYSRFSTVDTATLLVVCIGGALGSFIGAKLLKKFSGVMVRKIFGFFIIVAALRMVIG